jgi:RNA polymerase sigma-70 factor (ECF subfamily)
VTPDVFAAERPRLLGLAYRMLGSRVDAEDVVQDAWFRWQRADRPSIDRPEAWLTTVVARLSLDALRARQRDRTDYVGPWLPEPFVSGEAGTDPAATLDRHESLAIGFVRVLERLNPKERVVFVMADVFDEPYRDIADALGESEVNCRQLASRARRKIAATDADRMPAAADAPESGGSRSPDVRAALHAFLDAAATGNLDALLGVLSPEVVLISDGGAHRHAARRPVVGPHRVSRLVLSLAKRLPPDAQMRMPLVNAEPALIVDIGGRPDLLMTITIRGGLVAELHVILNRDKLARLDEPFAVA